jgi:hypothetical protein
MPARKTWMAGTSSAKTRFALLPGHDENYHLLRRINLIWAVQSHLQKHFRSSFTQITSINRAVWSHLRGDRDRHGRGTGCGGRGWCL